MRNVLRAVGAVIAVIALCSPLIFWPADNAQTQGTELAQATVTVPPMITTTTTTPPPRPTTTTSEPASPASTTTTTEPPIRITVAAVGDVIVHDSILESSKDPATGRYDFWPMFAPVATYLAKADYTVANLETRLADPEGGYSGDPAGFNSPAELADALKFSGVDLVATANNHSVDMKWEGIVSTLDRLDSAGLEHVGTYRSIEERRKPFLVDISGINVAFLNYTSSLNPGLTVPPERKDYAVNMLDPAVVAEDAMTARLWGADVVIALLHWGDEYSSLPSADQTTLARDLLSRGVDVILGSHSHEVQPIAHLLPDFHPWRYNDKYVAYSLGNFVSAQALPQNDNGIVAYVQIEKDGLRTRVTGISYLPVYVQHSYSAPTATFRVLPVLPTQQPDTDTLLSAGDNERMKQIWEVLRGELYRPDENISPLYPAQLGL